ncbi:MAG: glycosyltransferase [Bacteroidales bacterium]
MKNILIIQEALDGGGAEKVLIDILHNFDYTKYKVDLLVLFKYGVYLNQIPPQVNVIYLYPKGKVGRLEKKFRKKSYYPKIQRYRIRQLLKGKIYDASISFMEGPSSRFQSFIFDRSKKNISWIHTDMKRNHWSLKHFKTPEIEKAYYENVNQIVFVSEASRDAFYELYPEVKTPTKVIYNLINKPEIIKKASSETIPKNKFTICHIGRLSPIKRQDRLLEMAKLLQDNHYDVDIRILGAGPEEEALRKQRDLLGLKDSVHFIGFKSNPYPYLKNADIFILTSDAEGFPLVVCESLCLGIPVISTKATGLIELLGNQSGILTELNAEALFEATKSLIDNPILLEEYKKRASERSKMFDVRKTISEIESAME